MLLGACVVSVLIAVGAERFAYRPLRHAPRLAPLITAIGLSLALQEIIRNEYPDATSARVFPQPHAGPWHLTSQLAVQSGDLFVVVAAPVCMIALAVFVRKSRTGRAMQATAQDPATAQLMGIDTNRIIATAFAVGGLFAGVAAVGYGLRYGQVRFDMGFQAGLKAFTAAVLGGIGNIYGAMLGGIVLGLGETLASAYIADIPGMQQFGSSSWATVWAFVMLILVLLVRPQGLLGERTADRA
jgi:branched-chain amino acid transport system permease protein